MTHAPLLLCRDGALDDYLPLACHHYHPRRPATVARVLLCTDGSSGETAGALVISMPVLNSSWREAAFPGRYRSGSRHADAERLNAEVRTITRVVVDPRFRGLGVATTLVRRYLFSPLTAVTEAIAVMGAFSGFFRSAGMTEVHAPRSPRDLRLMDALAALHVDPWMLAASHLLPPRLLASPFLARELRRWAQGSRGTRPFMSAPTRQLLRRAAGVFHPPAAFVAVHPAGAPP
jgi:hypothetical protein